MSQVKRILTAEQKRERARIKRIAKRLRVDELRITPGFQTHEHLAKIVKRLPSDFEPYGKRSRDTGGCDCSCGCKWYHALEGSRGSDWGICGNSRSPRCGLLPFEHQSCPKFQRDPREEFLESAKGKRALKRFLADKEEIRTWHTDRHNRQTRRADKAVASD